MGTVIRTRVTFRRVRDATPYGYRRLACYLVYADNAQVAYIQSFLRGWGVYGDHHAGRCYHWAKKLDDAKRWCNERWGR